MQFSALALALVVAGIAGTHAAPAFGGLMAGEAISGGISAADDLGSGNDDGGSDKDTHNSISCGNGSLSATANGTMTPAEQALQQCISDFGTAGGWGSQRCGGKTLYRGHHLYGSWQNCWQALQDSVGGLAQYDSAECHNKVESADCWFAFQ